MAYIQDFDIKIEPTENAERTLPDKVYDNFEIKEVKITQRYGAGGSIAEVQVLYDDDISVETISDLARNDHQTEMGFEIKESLTIPPTSQIESQREEIVSEYFKSLSEGTNTEIGYFNAVRNAEENNDEVSREEKEAVYDYYNNNDEELTGYYRVYTGRPIEVVQKNDGIVKFKFLNRRLKLNKKFAMTDSNDGEQSVYSFVDELLRSVGGLEKGPDDDLKKARFEQSPTYDYLIEPDLKDNTFTGTYGIEEPESLFQILQSIAVKNEVHLWIDKHNTIRLERKPDSTLTIPQLITDIEAGDKQEATETIVKTPYDQTGVGKFTATGATMATSFDGVEEFPMTGIQGEDTDGEKILVAYGVSNSDEADRYARSMYISDELSKNYGKVTTMGNPLVSTYDEILLHHIPNMSPISEGSYSVKQVIHKISAEDGFTTEYDLAKSVRGMRINLHDNLLPADQRLIRGEKTDEEILVQAGSRVSH